MRPFLVILAVVLLTACRQAPDARLTTPSADEPFADVHADIVR